MIKIIFNLSDIDDLYFAQRAAKRAIEDGFDGIAMWEIDNKIFVINKNKKSYTVWKTK